ncbi:PP2C family protein-serine/threonine phosphatase [Aquipuribacter nitratireducens]|uniref:PP2C family protein-serine/threonine phosphatase n=1 Tax=Aquipuribacter nitratireducens TaxID=650104 RepID=A0ABW0GPU1_9MICO
MSVPPAARDAGDDAALLRAAVESGLDGMVVVSTQGRMIAMNHQFLDIWRIPADIAASGDDQAALAWAQRSVVDPDAFLRRVEELYADGSTPARDELQLVDGRVLDRYGTPLRAPDGTSIGWAWYFRDVTVERRAAQEAIEAGERFRRLARTLQDSLLPPVLPDVPGAEIAARYLPGSEVVDVVGDFYDVFQTGEHGWALTVGDVCGKGVEAATVTALARYTIRAAAVTRTSPSSVLRLLDEALRRQHPDSERFVTAAYLALRLEDGACRLTVSLGGHPPALCRRADGTVEPLGEPGMVLGVFEQPMLSDAATVLHPGDSVLLYTDGVTEARHEGEQFGEQRLVEVLRGCDGPAADTARCVEEAVLAFAQRQSDDTAVLVVRVPPA